MSHGQSEEEYTNTTYNHQDDRKYPAAKRVRVRGRVEVRVRVSVEVGVRVRVEVGV
jgi:hypothetical protein